MLIKYNNYFLNLEPILGQLDFRFNVNICNVKCIDFNKQTLFPKEGGHKIWYGLIIYNQKNKNNIFIRYSYNRKYKHIYKNTYNRKIKIYNKIFGIDYNSEFINLGIIKQYFFKRKIIKYMSSLEKYIYRKRIYDDKKGNILVY